MNVHCPECQSEGEDEWVWKRGKNGEFNVKSLYDHLAGNDRGDSFTRIWKEKIPYKIKNFIWLLENNFYVENFLTKENMIKKKWVGDPTCQFCNETETIDHLFFGCVGIFAQCFGANNIPSNVRQYWVQVKIWLPGGGLIHTFGLATICWAI
jgi:hypothetical protein